MAVSLKQMADSIEQIQLAMQRVEVGQHRHWMSPYCETDRSISIINSVKTLTRSHTVTHIQILNPGPEPASVTINVFDQKGSLQTDLVKTLSLSPRSMDRFMMGESSNRETFLGWLEIVASKPIFPSGYVTTNAVLFTAEINPKPPF